MRKWFILVVASLFFCYEFVQMTMMNAIGLNILSALSLSSEELAILSAAYYVILILLTLPAGNILDCFSEKKVILITFAISIVGTFTLASAESLPIAIAGRSLSGVGGAFAFLSCLRVISKYFKGEQLGTAIGVVVSIAFIGGMLSQAPLTFFAQSVGWQNAIRILAVLGIVSWILNFAVVSEQTTILPLKKQALFHPLTSALKSKRGLIGSGFTAVLNLPVITIGAVWGIVFFIEVDSFSIAKASVLLTVFYFGVLLGSPLAGHISDRYMTKKQAMMLFSFLGGLVPIFIILIPIANDIEGAIAFFILGVIASSHCIGYSVVIENNKPEYVASASSLGSILVMGGGALVKVIQGALMTTSGGFLKLHNLHVPLYLHISLITAMSILPILSLIIFLLVWAFY